MRMEWPIATETNSRVRWPQRDVESNLSAQGREYFVVGPLDKFIDELASKPFDKTCVDILLLFLKSQQLEIISEVHIDRLLT
ncbi:hypothetical protein CSQ96_21350 [Janthinobacterium sp. BJB412]|nr:hypothetical protein CSQ96_21350 [Janthinobacterium sp. BJB412]